MICFGSLERDYSLSKGHMTLEKGLRSQHGKDVQLHNSRGSPRPVNELRTICASIFDVIATGCKNRQSRTTCGYLGSCLACVYGVMDARGKFGEHEKSVRVARGEHGDNNLGGKTCFISS